ncbi:MAG: 1-acyl-sn-glycerol-3-phosphate acyltransferase [Nitrospina sp.]|jgi:1-acyl-sn-glycerol-3-phosphate acyltransferase|nr:1-acyl-sn-glycerol-3-phosphate acyltransferase [Nitrospina sp.]MBT3414556.1 1-acyl-sn-glycerol-3-phosphate acyltransferase [Nitrospina sp.]MBT3856510.1 1-acyl-sn-glycerol-3-phosphate acyltransferase [Nitrospina sp.]MBT4103277.1 1-acyl-sn-glycerol-3-phosphate acyltransferase [Nitrospina sp.]MBT4389389.1 1-acyl-sn-glycerol-3-phosphate acyltransferase [Nitrospina sp.]
MRHCLAVIRIGAYIGVFVVFAIIGACGHILFFMSRARLLNWIAFFAQWWARVTCLIFNIQIRIEGDVNIKSGSLIVANHVGSPDIFILGACFKGFFVSKSEIADWPLFSWLARLGITIFADRSKRHQVKAVIREIEERLNADHSVILFPEAQATDGTDVVPFKSAVFQAAVLASRPVVPVTIRYHDDNQPTIAHYGNSFFEHIMGLLKTPRLEATVMVLPEISAGPNRQTLAEKSYRAVRDKVVQDISQSE